MNQRANCFLISLFMSAYVYYCPALYIPITYCCCLALYLVGAFSIRAKWSLIYIFNDQTTTWHCSIRFHNRLIIKKRLRKFYHHKTCFKRRVFLSKLFPYGFLTSTLRHCCPENITIRYLI